MSRLLPFSPCHIGHISRIIHPFSLFFFSLPSMSATDVGVTNSNPGYSRLPAAVPLDVLRQTRGKPVSIELRDGSTVNGTVMHTDKAMNLVLKAVIKTSASGKDFWRCREAFIRGTSVRNIRMPDAVLKAPDRSKHAARKRSKKQGDPPQGKANSTGKRPIAPHTPA